MITSFTVLPLSIQELYDAKALEIHNERISLDKQIAEHRTNDPRPAFTLEPIKNVFVEASRAMKDFSDATEPQKRKILEKLLWNLSIKNQNVAQYKFKSEYAVLAKSPKTGDISMLCAVWDEVGMVLMGNIAKAGSI